MNIKVIRMMFWMGLLVLLLGQNNSNLIVAGAGGVVPERPSKVAQSQNCMVASGGIVAEPPSKPTMSIIA
jgi:hypothetical protein